MLQIAMQPPVAIWSSNPATVSGMADWKKYSRIGRWAKRAMAAKGSGKNKISDRAIAAFVTAETGKNSERSLINAWMNEEREPYLSQFFALCQYLKLDPGEMLGLEVGKTLQTDTENNQRNVVRSVRYRTDNGATITPDDLRQRAGSVSPLRKPPPGAKSDGFGVQRKRTKPRSNRRNR